MDIKEIVTGAMFLTFYVAVPAGIAGKAMYEIYKGIKAPNRQLQYATIDDSFESAPIRADIGVASHREESPKPINCGYCNTAYLPLEEPSCPGCGGTNKLPD
jgi:hypothetical protein